MKTFDRLEISPVSAGGKLWSTHGAPHPKARRVWGLIDGKVREAGWLMPEFEDSRQQPKSLALKLREELNRRNAG